MLNLTEKNTMSKMTENHWRDRFLRPALDFMGMVHFVKEAKSIRGLPDIVGVWKGEPIFLEVKKSKASLNHPRTRLQAYQLQKLIEQGSLGSFIYPENANTVLKAITDVLYSQEKLTHEDRKKIFKYINEHFEEEKL